MIRSGKRILHGLDYGQGFDVKQISHNSEFGLLEMSERVEQIGGDLVIRSQPEQGTEVVVIVNWE